MEDYTDIRQAAELIFLPTYSPNVNLIEKIWKFVKSEVLNTAYYGTFGDFKDAIDNCIFETDKCHLNRISSLITENIQQFKNPTNSEAKIHIEENQVEKLAA